MIRTEPAVSSAVGGGARPETSDPAASSVPSSSADRTSRWSLLGIAGGFVLLFLSQSPGRLAADTKMDVALEPWRFLERATHLWNSSSDFGFLPNQYAGYLFPMGPFFLAGDAGGVPPWITQRLWMALILTLGAWGIVRLADAMAIGRPATRVLAGLVYTLSPMFFGKIGSTSVALTGAAMLPWIVLPLVLTLRPDGAGGAVTGLAAALGQRAGPRRLAPRRAAALSGIAILGTGGVNASVTMCVLLLPAVLLLFAGNTRRAWALRGWWFVAVVFATAWWILALLVQAKYGLNFLPYTETAETTTSTASVAEALRGTTDWMAYLRLPSPWVPAATDYVTEPAAIVGSGVLTAVGLWGLARADLPGRRFGVVGLVVGVVAVASAYPGAPAGLFSDGVRELLTAQLGFLRNVYKFQPVVRVPIALGIAHATAVALRPPAAPRPGSDTPDSAESGATPHAQFQVQPSRPEPVPPAADEPRRRVGGTGRLGGGLRWVAVAVTLGALVAGITPALDGRVMSPGSFEEVPDYWVEAADWLSNNPEGGRTLVVPGTPFGEYDWGRPLDEPLQWLSTTPWGVRSLIPLGGVGVTRLMDGIERQLSLGSAPGLEVALARAGIGQLVVRNDLQNKDWDVPPSARQVRRALEASNLTLARTFGPEVDVRLGAKDRLVDDPSQIHEQVPSLEVWTVPDGASMVETYPADTAMLVSGGAEATVQLAAQGLLDPGRAVVLASDLADLDTTAPAGGDDSELAATGPAPDAPPVSSVVGPSTTWVDTDTFDRRDFQFGLVHGASSYLLGPTESAAGATGPIGQWTDRPVTGHQTVAGYVDGMSVTASSYGFDLAQAPDLAPFNAVDEATYTAWQARSYPRTGSEGAWLRLDAGRPVTVPNLQVRLLAETSRRPAASAIRVTTEAGSIVTAVERNEDAQILRMPTGPTRWFELTLLDVGGEGVDPVLGAGLREVTVPGVRFQRYTQLPADAARLFTTPTSGAVAYSFDRERVDPATPFGGDEERSMVRRFDVPRDMDFRVAGAATYILPDDPNQLRPPEAPVPTVCGAGPMVNIDGVQFETRFLGGTLADVARQQALPIELCVFGGTLRLTAGPHVVSVVPGYSTLDSLTLVDALPRPQQPGPRSTQVGEWSSERRTVEVGAGERAFLAVRENSNPSWTASLGGEQLEPVRLDGWQQGWIVPAGVGGTVVIENVPGVSYQRNLLVGGFLVLLLFVMLALPERFKLRPRSDPDGVPDPLAVGQLPWASTIARVPGWFWAAAFGTVAMALVAGPVAVAVPVGVFVALRWPRVLPWAAFLAALAAGIAVAAAPNSAPGSGEGAFSWFVQLCGALAVVACVSATAVRSPSRDDPPVVRDDDLPVAGRSDWSGPTQAGSCGDGEDTVRVGDRARVGGTARHAGTARHRDSVRDRDRGVPAPDGESDLGRRLEVLMEAERGRSSFVRASVRSRLNREPDTARRGEPRARPTDFDALEWVSDDPPTQR